MTIYPAFVPWDMAFGRRFFSSRGKPVLPLASLSHRLTGLCSSSGRLLSFETDEFGFRNPPRAHTQKEIAVIGDSFAHGYCVPESESIPGILRGRFGSTLNLGVTGAGPLWELGVLREYGPAVRPRRVVWLFFEGNDLEGLALEKAGLLPRYLDLSYSQDLRSRQQLVDSLQLNRLDSLADALLRPGKERIRRTMLLREIRGRLGINIRSSESALPESDTSMLSELAILQSVLEIGREAASTWGGRVLFVYLPERSRFTNPANTASEVDRHRRAKESVLDIARVAGMDVLDLLPVFAAERSPLGLWDDERIHYNARGYRVAAEAIAGELTRLDQAGKADRNTNPQRRFVYAAEDYWIQVEPVRLSMVRKATSDR
jgi:hypothetical protein